MSHDMIVMKQPANSELQMWKTALPLGNGITGALVYGAIAEETVVLTRHDLWENPPVKWELPDISHKLPEARRLIDAGDYVAANALMQDHIRSLGYTPDASRPFPLGMLSLDALFNTGNFRRYRRGIDMAAGEAFVRWEDNGSVFERRAFVSRENGAFYLRVRGERAGEYRLTLGACDHRNALSKEMLSQLAPHVRKMIDDRALVYTVASGKQLFGAALTVELNTDGRVTVDEAEGAYVIDCADFTVKVLTFAKTPTGAEDALATLFGAPTYDVARAAHAAAHAALYTQTTVALADDDDPAREQSNEELLAAAYEGESSSVLYEKLWKFGRYLFISGTAKGGNPFPLYGLWAGDYCLPWTQHVANQNVEMIYWHAYVGGLTDALKELIHYYYGKMPAFREDAQKVFGCRGIYVPTYTAPETLDGTNPAYVLTAAVVLNWISCAGWLSYHFYQYYEYTGDEELLKAEIIPFMCETARFYADYATRDAAGKCRIYPTVSPENTPRNFLDADVRGLSYLCNPAVENATMDFALIKSLLGHLFELEQDGLLAIDDADKAAWEDLLSSLPDYQINDDGALKEWTSPHLQDNYAHRHFSHLFPLFPGDEFDPTDASELTRAAERAVELRETDAQSGWSFAHSACLWARLGDGDRVLDSVERLARSCVLNNFFTTHNDHRHMGVSLYMNNMDPPMQLDALLGMTNAVLEMLIHYRRGVLRVMPAPTAKLPYIKATGLKFPQGELSLARNGEKFTYTIAATADGTLRVKSPTADFSLKLQKGQSYTYTEAL